MFFKFIPSLFFNFLIVNAKVHHSIAPARRGFFLKALNPSNLISHSSSNDVSPDHTINASGSGNQTAPGSDTTDTSAPSNNTNSNGDQNNSASSTTNGYPEPDANITSICSSQSGKPVNFVNRECWYAAKVMAEDGTSTSQCGHCVLGLYDADKKAIFKPSGPLNASFIQEQAMKLLDQCKSSGAPKISRRDSSSNNSTSEANVQLLVGYKPQSKPCPGL